MWIDKITEPGLYWWFGQMGGEFVLKQVQAYQGRNELVFTSDGEFVYERTGKFQKVDKPPAPFTLEQLISQVRLYASKYPDAVYAKEGGHCSYYTGAVSNGSCGCIFGQILTSWGYQPQEDTRIGMVLESIGFERTKELLWCHRVQVLQDQRFPWSDCVKIADEHFPLDKQL